MHHAKMSTATFDPDKRRLVRLHPSCGGKNIDYEGQRFNGVSPDVFIGTDIYNHLVPYFITRKLNITIQIDPKKWPARDFFRYLTIGAGNPPRDPFASDTLKATSKCQIHGDRETDLAASKDLMDLLKPPDLNMQQNSTGWGFTVAGKSYIYQSIGVAANEGYAAVSKRKTSHFEIKFQRVNVLHEILCLNIHLMPPVKISFDVDSVKERLRVAIRLFYKELGVLNRADGARTDLKTALNVTLDDYRQYKFSYIHEQSIEAMDEYKWIAPYRPVAPPSVNDFIVASLAPPIAPATKPSAKAWVAPAKSLAMVAPKLAIACPAPRFDQKRYKPQYSCFDHRDLALQQRVQQQLPPTFIMGVAYGHGDCFYDAAAKCLNVHQKINSANTNPLYIRKVILDYVNNLPGLWLDSAIRKEGKTFADYRDKIGLCYGHGDEVIWGRPEIEGRILCEIFKIQLHIIEVNLALPMPILHQMVNYAGSKSIAQDAAGYGNPNVIHLLTYNLHTIPIYAKPVQQH